VKKTSATRARPSVFYTSVKGKEVDGFQIAASSDELTDEVRRAIELHSAANGRNLNGLGSAVRFYRAGDSWAITRLVPAAADYTGREGNVLAHTILLEEGDVADSRFSVNGLLASGVFEDALPGVEGPPQRAVLPEGQGSASYRFLELEDLFGDALPSVIGWLAAEKHLAVIPTDELLLTARHCETLRQLLVGNSQDTFTFSTLNDNPVIRPYALCALLTSTTPDTLATWRARDPNLAVYNVGERSWSVPPRFTEDQGALAYGEHLVALLTAASIPGKKRIKAARRLQRYTKLFADTKRVELLTPGTVSDAGELVRVSFGLLGTDRPQLKCLRCLLPYVRADHVVDELDKLLPDLVAEAVEHSDVAVLVNSCLVLTHRRSREAGKGAGQHVALQVSKGLKQAWRWAGPLLFEFEAAATKAELPPEITDRMRKLVNSRSATGGWTFTTRGLQSLARFGGRGTRLQPDLGLQVLQDLLAQAAREPSLLGHACEAFSPNIPAWIPDDRIPIDPLVELFARSGEDLGVTRGEDLARIVEQTVTTGHTSALSINSKRLLEAGLPPRTFIDACILLRLPEILVKNAKRMREASSVDLARATHALLKSGEGRDALSGWLKNLPYDVLPSTLCDLDSARVSFETEQRFSEHLAGRLAERERDALLEALDHRLSKLERNEASPLVTRQLIRELRPYVGWKTLLLGNDYYALGLAAKNMILRPRLGQVGHLAFVSFLTVIGALLGASLCLPFNFEEVAGAFLRDAGIPLTSTLFILAAWRWRRWNDRIGDAWEDLGHRWRFRAGPVLRVIALMLAGFWVLLLGDVLPTSARDLVDIPLSRVGTDWPLAWGLPMTGGSLLTLAAIFGLFDLCGSAGEDDEAKRRRTQRSKPSWAGAAGMAAVCFGIISFALWGLISWGWVDAEWLPEAWRAARPPEVLPVEPSDAAPREH
jgi:hypothetical protein